MTDNRTTELLPCPICGGQPDFQHFNITPNVQGRIICSCGIELRQGKNDTEDDMRIIWNTRVEQTCEPKWTLQGKTQTQEFWRCDCGNCGECFGVEDRRAFVTLDKVDVPNFCPNCGKAVKL